MSEPAAPALERLPWRFAFSPTLKSIYVLRYLLFSGGLAIAGAMVERVVTHGDRVGAGLVAGLGAGLVWFRGQLRPFRVPILGLGQQHLFFARQGRAVEVSWSNIQEITSEHRTVQLRFGTAQALPDGKTGDVLRLDALDYGVTAPALHRVLDQLGSAGARLQLPTDAQVRERLKVK